MFGEPRRKERVVARITHERRTIVEKDRFDDLIRNLGKTRLTRGSTLRGFVAGLATAVTGLGLSALDSEAKKKKRKGAKKKSKSKSHKKGRATQQAVTCPNTTYKNPVSYRGQGLDCNGSDCELQTVECDANNTPYLLWVLTATGAAHANISLPDGTHEMTKKGNGAFQYRSGWFDLNDLQACASYDGTAKNAQLVISHGCPCVPKTCQDLGICGKHLDAGCGKSIDCDCPTTCPPDTTYGPNTDCKNGKCVCKPDTCPTDGTVGQPCGSFDDKCCGEYECECTHDCPGGGKNNTCGKDGVCECDPDTCPTDGKVGEPCGKFPDGCCDEYECNCSTECPDGGANNTCGKDGTCECEKTPKNVACEGKCGQTVADGCCGEYECDACCQHSCTLGRYRQGCYPPGYSASTPFPCANNKGYDTFGQALAASGPDQVWAQRAAALLNLAWFGCYAYEGDICTANIADLDAANQHDGNTGRTCPPISQCGQPV
jgi:hypothetical protein